MSPGLQVISSVRNKDGKGSPHCLRVTIKILDFAVAMTFQEFIAW